MEFIRSYPVDKLKPADYNPRKITEEAFLKLQESLKAFGVIKPVIANGDSMTLTAGHQRTKAMKAAGIKTCPVIKIKGVNKKDEIRFNLFHNSIETNKTKVILNQEHLKLNEYTFIQPSNISFEKNMNATVVKEICRLIARYGTWGSVVADTNGHIITNSDYAVACFLLSKELLVYTIDASRAKELTDFLNIDYGEYYYDSINAKAYNQHRCQLHRLRHGAKDNKSTLYEGYVIPWLTNNKDKRGLDFGAGQCDYAKALKKQGYKILPYEPHMKAEGKVGLDIRAVVKMLKMVEKDVEKNGLYDFVVLDSVINSITSCEFEDFVMKTCNSFLKEDGILFLGTRNYGKCIKTLNQKKNTNNVRDVEFTDANNFSITYRGGVWTKQKFHTLDSLKELSERYFEEVEIYGSESASQIYSVSTSKKAFEREVYKKALETELNMEYPNGYKHNQHEKLLELVLKNNETI